MTPAQLSHEDRGLVDGAGRTNFPRQLPFLPCVQCVRVRPARPAPGATKNRDGRAAAAMAKRAPPARQALSVVELG